VFSERLETLTGFIELQVGHPVIHRYYTDTGPLLERDLAQRAGLGWIGKNTCLIHPRYGSYFLLAEVLLDLEITIDTPLNADHCGTCTRCIEACPTECILPDRTLDSGRCISYLTIESREAIPAELRPLIGEWIFGCDICQMVCPWNRFAAEEGDAAFRPRDRSTRPELMEQLRLTPSEYSREFKTRAVRRAKHRDYRRNVLVAIGNAGDSRSMPALRAAAGGSDPLIREHAAWALQRIAEGAGKSDE
jgi:epoxyqueuosine reductase